MNKGGRAKAPVAQPTKGKMDTKKPAKSDVKFGYAPAGRKGNKA
jgi:hypothetical protein